MEVDNAHGLGESLALPIVIWAANFDPNSGGCIVLHMLAHRLRQLGVEAYVSHSLPKTQEPTPGFGFGRAIEFLRQANRNRLARRRGEARPLQTILFPDLVQTHAAMPVPHAPFMNGRAFVAVYPEIIAGNPFDAPHVVRWLLFDPVKSGRVTQFGPDELTFFYQHVFAADVAGIDPDNLLQTRWLRDDIYSNHGAANRGKQCRMIRKGDAAILLDGKSHAEIAH